MTKYDLFIDTRRPLADGSYPIKIRLLNGGKKMLIATGFTSESSIVSQQQMLKTKQLAWIVDRLDRICCRKPNVTLNELKDSIKADIDGVERDVCETDTLAYYCAKYAEGLKKSTAVLYRNTSDRVREFDPTACLDSTREPWLSKLEVWLREKRGLSVNGIAQKMRCIRTVFNWCREQGLTDNYPFRGRDGYKIHEEETIPNALSAQEFADLRDYPCEPWQQIYIDMFCLSTYLAGVNVGDMLLCKGLEKGRFVFVRRKTDKANSTKSRKISLPVCPEAMAIINKYKGENYLLNIMDNMKDYHTFMQHWNAALKKIGPSRLVPDKLGKLRKIERSPIFPCITSYSARYTFASVAANDLDISESTIGKCLGHAWASGKQVTSRYISHDQRKIDAAIYRVVEFLNKFEGRYKENPRSSQTTDSQN